MSTNGLDLQEILDKQHSKRSTQEMKRRATELEIIAEVSLAATRLLDSDTLLQTVVDLVKAKFDLYHVHVYILDESGENLILAAGAGEIGRLMVEEGHSISIQRPQSLVARAARTRKGVTINDVTNEPGFLPNPHLPLTHAEMSLPMTVGDELLGVLDFQSVNVGHFNDDDVRVKTVLAQQIAIALRNANAFVEQQRQLLLQESSAQIANYLRYSTASVEDMLDSVMQVMVHVFEADTAVLSVFIDEANTWQGLTGVGTGMTREIAQSFIDSAERYPHALEALQTQQVVVVPYTERYPGFPEEFLDEKLGLKSVLALPIKLNEQRNAVLFLNYSTHYHSFSAAEVSLARLLDDQISVGLQHRADAQQIQLQRERAELQSRVASALALAKDEDEILHAMSQLGAGIDAEQGFLVYFESSEDDSILAASIVAMMDNAGQRVPLETLQRSRFSHAEFPIARLLHEQPTSAVLFEDVKHDPRTREDAALQAFIDSGELKAVTLLPLRYNGVWQGCLAFVWRTPQIFPTWLHEQLDAFIGPFSAVVATRRAYLAEQAARASSQVLARDLAIVSEVGVAINNILDVDALLRQVVELTKERFSLYHVNIYLLDSAGQYLTLAAASGAAGQMLKAHAHRVLIDHPSSIVARAAREQVPLVEGDITANEAFLPNPLLPDTRSVIATPMMTGHQLIGVLDIQADVIRHFDANDIATMSTLAVQIGAAITNARAFDQILRTQSELSESLSQRARIEQQVRRQASELQTVANISTTLAATLDQDELLQKVVDLTKDNFSLYHAHIYLLDTDEKYLVLSAGAGDIGRKMKDRGHRISLDHPRSIVARAGRTGEAVISNDVTQQPDFLPNPQLPNTLSEMAVPMVVGSTVIGVLDVQSDTLNRFNDQDVRVQTTLAAQVAIAVQNARAYQQVVHSREQVTTAGRRLELATRAGSIGVWEWNLIENRLVWDEECYRLYRVKREDFSGAYEAWASALHPDDAEVTQAALQDALAGVRPYDLEYRAVLRDGAVRIFKASAEVIRSDDGTPVNMVGIIWDITDRKSQEEAIRQAQQKTQRIYDLSVDLIGTARQSTSSFEELNPAWERTLGFTLDELRSKPFFEFIHPDDVQPTFSEFQRQINEGKKSVNFVNRYATKDGGYRLISWNAVPVPEEDMTYFVCHDVTEERAALQSMQDIRRRLELAAGAGGIGVWEWNLVDNSLVWDDQMYALYGVTRDKFSGAYDAWANGLHPEDSARSQAEINDAIAGGKPFDTEFRVVWPDGTIRYVKANAALIRDEHGKPVSMIGVNWDITDRKTAEVTIGRRATELQTVATVSAAASRTLDQDELLQSVVELTKTNFGLYHAHIYLLDDDKEYLVLAAGAGEPGQVMKQRHHRIPFNHPNSIVASAARTGQAVIANDVSKQPDFLPNPLLPLTRSEIAVPMIVGDTVIGVLDVQSEALDHFGSDDVLVKTTLAGQIAVAVQNASAYHQVLSSREQASAVGRRLELATNTAGIGIWEWNLVDNSLVWDDQMYAIYGVARSQFSGAYDAWANGLHPEDSARSQEEINTAIAGGKPFDTEFRVVWPNGTIRYVKANAALIRDEHGKPISMIGVNWDITERREIELERERILRLTEEQAQHDRETAERLRELDRLKSQFLANMSHELRTPLNSIIGYSEVLLDGDDGELTEDAVEDITTIHSSGRHLLSIINEILDLAKIEAGQMSIDQRPTDLVKIASEVLQTAQVLVKDKGLTLTLVEETPIEMVKADPIRLRQILTNLVSNAVKFTEQGGVTVLYGREAEDMAYVEVQDTGIGMSEEDLPVIFQQFRQVDGSSTRRAGGTGLGLTITKALVEMHGGGIVVRSTVGEGTTFRFTLPFFTMEEVIAN